jgi:hypothetical protein
MSSRLDKTWGQGLVIAQTSNAEISPDEAMHAATLLEAKRKTIETCELEARLNKIEARLEGGT